MTDPLGQSQVIPYLEGLSKEGFEITLISCEKKIPYKDFNKAIANQLERAGIIWAPVKYTKTPPVISTVYDLFILRKKAFELHKKKNFTIVHCRSYISAFVGLWMKKRYGTKFLFDMRGFWPDERVEGGIWNIKNPLYKIIYIFFKKQELRFLRNADHIVSLTHKGKDIINSWQIIPGKIPPITVIPCCVDTNHFDPEKVNDEDTANIRKRLGINSNDKILTYLGSLGTWYLVDEMLFFFKDLLNNYPEYKFLFITKDSKDGILKKANKIGIPEDKLFFTSSERKELPAFLSISNLAISFIKPCFSKSASSPTKLGELLSMGIPVICNSGVGDVDYILKDQFSILLYPLDKKFYFSESDLMNLRKNDFKELVDNSFSLEKGIEKYNLVYHTLIKNITFVDHFNAIKSII